MVRRAIVSSVYDGNEETRRRSRSEEGQGISSSRRRRLNGGYDHGIGGPFRGNGVLTRRMAREKLATVHEEEEVVEVVAVEGHDQRKSDVAKAVGKGKKRVENGEVKESVAVPPQVSVDEFELNVPTLAGWKPWRSFEEQAEWFDWDFVSGPPTVEIAPRFGGPPMNVVTDDVYWNDTLWNFGDMPKPKPF